MMNNPLYPGFIPVTVEEKEAMGIDQFDFVYVSADAYVDHPSFGTAIICRIIEKLGYTVGIISQPDWHSTDAFRVYGRPKYAFMVGGGCIDSMVNNYTAAKKRRHDDAYSPGGKGGRRPDRAVTVYCNRIRQAYGNVPIVIGGYEASLRRFAHYDYWQDKVRSSILVDTGADICSYGMGETSTTQIVTRLAAGENIKDINDVLGTCVLTREKPEDAVECPSFEKVRGDDPESKKQYAQAMRIQYNEQDAFGGKTIIQRHGGVWLKQNPPSIPLDKEELDKVYDLPFKRAWHPIYDAMGGVPAITEVEHSIAHNRGCFGGCNFCSIVFHEGRYVTSRTEENILKEGKKITESPNFKGYIHDVGGPTANFRRSSCDKKSMCKNRRCLAPYACPNLKVDHTEYLEILRKLRALPKVKKVFVRSGIRYDYLIEDKNTEFFEELIKYHISGQLKVAPEHCSNKVLDYMGKPHFDVYQRFYKKFLELNKKAGMNQYLVPYMISSHPGCTLNDAIDLALYLKSINYHPEQVQDFYPTPGTISTCMFWTGIDPMTGKEVYVPRTPKEKAYQRALLQCTKPENAEIVKEALTKAGRKDLIPVLIPSAARQPINKPKGGSRPHPTVSIRKRNEMKNSQRNKKK